jgi:pyruvate dehydrogenase E2 component (dihydrolipoamide acetyltransferase)
MATEIILPKLGQTVEEGTIVEWLKQEGDAVRRGEVLFTVETDKATLDVEATKSGYLRRILVPEGETAPVLQVVGWITPSADEPLEAVTEGEPTEQRSQGERAQGLSPSQEREGEAVEDRPRRERIFASPRARRVARERGVELERIEGSGPHGRIVERDVLSHLEAAPKATPVARRLAEAHGVDLREVDGTGPRGRITKADVRKAERALEQSAEGDGAATAPTTVTQPLVGVRAIIARRMHESHSRTAPVTLTTEVDATAFVEFRERLKSRLAEELGFNVGYNDLLIHLTAKALRSYPYMNARLNAEAGVIEMLEEVHVALAIDTERGLLAPVIRNADQKGIVEVAHEIRALVTRARAGNAEPDELTGSTFTITNLGMYAIDAFTPIINLPETAILGVGRIKERAAVYQGTLAVRKSLWLSLTFDHRLVDGAPAARFLHYLSGFIEEPYLLLA